MNIDKKTLKRIYKLAGTYNNGRVLKRKLEEIYSIKLTNPVVSKIKSNISIESKRDFYKRRILYMYANCSNINKLAEYLNDKYDYNFTYQGLVTYCHKNGVQKKNRTQSSFRQITKEEESKIVELYELGFNSYELADMFGYKTKKSILDILRANNVEVRNSGEIASSKRTYRDFSFEKLDSEEKAYIIGLLLSDGYVIGERNYIGIDLCDLDAIKFVSDFINVKYNTIPSKKDNHKDKYRMVMYGKEYVKQLKRFGIFPRKSLTTDGCNLHPDEIRYIPSILRGLIDGDGWIREDGGEFFISSASESLINWIHEKMLKLGFKDIEPVYYPNETNGIYIIRTAIQENVAILRNKVYENRMGMERKYNRLHMIDVQRA